MLKQPLQKNVQVVVPVIVSVGRFGRVLFKTNKNESSRKDSYPSPCRLFYQCKTCRVTLQHANRSPELHVCQECMCPNYHEYQLGASLLSKITFGPEIDKRKKFIYYDFEPLQDEVFHCQQGYRPPSIRHVVMCPKGESMFRLQTLSNQAFTLPEK